MPDLIIVPNKQGTPYLYAAAIWILPRSHLRHVNSIEEPRLFFFLPGSPKEICLLLFVIHLRLDFLPKQRIRATNQRLCKSTAMPKTAMMMMTVVLLELQRARTVRPAWRKEGGTSRGHQQSVYHGVGAVGDDEEV